MYFNSKSSLYTLQTWLARFSSLLFLAPFKNISLLTFVHNYFIFYICWFQHLRSLGFKFEFVAPAISHNRLLYVLFILNLHSYSVELNLWECRENMHTQDEPCLYFHSPGLLRVSSLSASQGAMFSALPPTLL